MVYESIKGVFALSLQLLNMITRVASNRSENSPQINGRWTIAQLEKFIWFTRELELGEGLAP